MFYATRNFQCFKMEKLKREFEQRKEAIKADIERSKKEFEQRKEAIKREAHDEIAKQVLFRLKSQGGSFIGIFLVST